MVGGTRAPQDLWGDQDDGSSPGGISVLSGSPLTAWSSFALTARSQTEYAIRLMPDSPVVVGRYHGLVPPYLDPAYRPTRIVPGTGQAVLPTQPPDPRDTTRDVRARDTHLPTTRLLSRRLRTGREQTRVRWEGWSQRGWAAGRCWSPRPTGVALVLSYEAFLATANGST